MIFSIRYPLMSILLVMFIPCLITKGLAEDPPVKNRLINISVEIDRGEDIGQNFGSLFELTNKKGEAVLGAGFQECYNTEARSDRHTLHFYLKSESFTKTPKFEPLPRSTTDSGVYLDDYQGTLFTKGRAGGQDGALKSWNEKQQKWIKADHLPFQTEVGNGTLSVSSTQATYNKKIILELSKEQGLIQSYYYANGYLVFRLRNPDANPPTNYLYACPWKPTDTGLIQLGKGQQINLRWEREFVYAYGQLNGDILVATNTGGVYCLKDHQWKALLEPDRNVSFQIYSMINYYDRILMGQYPTGELYSYDGSTLELIKDWPPVMEGVSKNAREAQSLAIYGGDLYVGVWPWGEVWKYQKSKDKWNLAKRMFSHPALTDKTTHPYEEEAKKVNKVYNIWGQRVTSLLPMNNSLYISTSAKTSLPYHPKYTFLDNKKWDEYGRVYRMSLPGNLSVRTDWENGKTKFQFIVTNDKMIVKQDGKLLGETSIPVIDGKLLGDVQINETNNRVGNGVYGKYRGKSIKARIKLN